MAWKPEQPPNTPWTPPGKRPGGGWRGVPPRTALARQVHSFASLRVAALRTQELMSTRRGCSHAAGRRIFPFVLVILQVFMVMKRVTASSWEIKILRKTFKKQYFDTFPKTVKNYQKTLRGGPKAHGPQSPWAPKPSAPPQGPVGKEIYNSGAHGPHGFPMGPRGSPWGPRGPKLYCILLNFLI